MQDVACERCKAGERRCGMRDEVRGRERGVLDEEEERGGKE